MNYNACFSIDLSEWFSIEYIKENFVQLLIILVVGIAIGFFVGKFIFTNKSEDQKQLSEALDVREKNLLSDEQNLKKQKEDFKKVKLEHEEEYRLFKEESQKRKDLYAVMSSDRKFSNIEEDDVDF